MSGDAMRAPIIAGFCPHDAEQGPVDLALATSRMTGDPVVVVVVLPGGSVLERLAGDGFGHGHGEAEAAVGALRERLQASGVEATVRVVEHSTPARGLAEAVEKLRPQLLVLGSTRRSLHGRVRLGSTAERLISGSPCPVAVVPRGHSGPRRSLATIGAAYAPTPEGHEALSAAARLARVSGARLRAVLVLDPRHAEEQSPGLMAGQHRDTSAAETTAGRHRLAAQADLEAAVAQLAPDLDVDVDVLFQEPAEGLQAASRVVDLLVMGSRGYGPLHAVMLGGVARRVVSRAACPVLVLPRGSEATADALLASAAADAAR
jgi:nucleotide-binding universal stress UspA family protein